MLHIMTSAYYKLWSHLARVDKRVADIALKEMRGHLWYLSEDLIGLALFSEFVWNSEKEAMIAALKRPPMKTVFRRVDQNFRPRVCLILSRKDRKDR